jgi:hypothetical protein
VRFLLIPPIDISAEWNHIGEVLIERKITTGQDSLAEFTTDNVHFGGING